MHKITLLGAGLIGRFYTISLQKLPGCEVSMICAKTKDNAQSFAEEFDIPRWSTSIEEAINDPETDTVVIGLPNYLHKPAVLLAAEAGKAVLCTKPLATNALEAKEMLEVVEQAGVFHGYLEDLVYTPKTLKALQAVQNGALGKILWARSRETHAGPHSDWFWDIERSGGGAIVDMGCHCIEIARDFIGKDVRPLEVTCWADTQVNGMAAYGHETRKNGTSDHLSCDPGIPAHHDLAFTIKCPGGRSEVDDELRGEALTDDSANSGNTDHYCFIEFAIRYFHFITQNNYSN